MRTLLLTLTMCLVVRPANAKYSGGTGEPNDPYQIATAADLIALGETPADYTKHFLLTADIDLDPNLPGRKVFDKAVIAPDVNETNWEFDGTPFTGVFDGNGHVVSHLTIKGGSYLGLFGRLMDLFSKAEVRNLGVLDVRITGSGCCVGGLVGYNNGTVARCYSTGVVDGNDGVGGLVGGNSGSITQCFTTGAVSGTGPHVGGLVGDNEGSIATSYSTGAVSGTDEVGGLVGANSDGGTIATSYSAGAVSGTGDYVGGLVGLNLCLITNCYSTGSVSGTRSVGGLVGDNAGDVTYSFLFFLGHPDIGPDQQRCWRGQDDRRDADGRDVAGCRVGLRGRDGQRHGGYLVDSRREGLSAFVVGSREEMKRNPR